MCIETRLNLIVCVAILLAIHQSYCLGMESVEEPVGARLDALVPLAVQFSGSFIHTA